MSTHVPTIEEHGAPRSLEAGSRIGRVLDRTNVFFDLPLSLRSRVLILLGVLILVPTYVLPLWHMTFYSNQYPDGLRLHIYTYKLEGEKSASRDDLREINELNHYIGMRPLLESDFSEFGWLPLGIGALGLLALRALIIGKMSRLVDVFVLCTYFGLFSLWSFYNRLYTYAHNLDPVAAMKVQPFTPPLLGSKQIANFTVESYPSIAAFALIASVALLAAAIVLSRRPVRV